MKAKEEADQIMQRIHPSVIYTLKIATIREILLQLTAGKLHYNGHSYSPVVKKIGAGVHNLSFFRIE